MNCVTSQPKWRTNKLTTQVVDKFAKYCKSRNARITLLKVYEYWFFSHFKLKNFDGLQKNVRNVIKKSILMNFNFLHTFNIFNIFQNILNFFFEFLNWNEFFWMTCKMFLNWLETHFVRNLNVIKMNYNSNFWKNSKNSPILRLADDEDEYWWPVSAGLQIVMHFQLLPTFYTLYWLIGFNILLWLADSLGKRMLNMNDRK